MPPRYIGEDNKVSAIPEGGHMGESAKIWQNIVGSALLIALCMVCSRTNAAQVRPEVL